MFSIFLTEIFIDAILKVSPIYLLTSHLSFFDILEESSCIYLLKVLYLEVVKLLLENGAEPAMKDIDGDNAETFARQNGHIEVAELLSEQL